MLDAAFPIRTARMALRPYQAADLAFLHSMFSREDVCRYLPWTPMDIDQARAKLKQRVRQVHLERTAIPLSSPPRRAPRGGWWASSCSG